jgi:ParB family chromosome partitioning protein
LELIDEDPQQPRSATNPGFSHRSLSELAGAIRERGVKTPISVRPNPACPGRYLVNHGARRLRASRLAGKTSIPAFIDTDYSESDQVVENLHRDGLTPREIADYIGRELSRGLRKKEIARQISKSAAFVTQHARLLDLPDAVACAFNQGRVRDVTVVNELATAHQHNGPEVERWLADPRQEITRSTVQLLRQFLSQRPAAPLASAVAIVAAGDAVAGVPEAVTPSPRKPRRHGSATLLVAHSGRRGRLMLDRQPSSADSAWVQFDESGTLEELELVELRLVKLVFQEDEDRPTAAVGAATKTGQGGSR